jgi:hypothetical protein
MPVMHLSSLTVRFSTIEVQPQIGGHTSRLLHYLRVCYLLEFVFYFYVSNYLKTGKSKQMSGKSAIEWTNMTWNPTIGCTRATAGCDHCYAFLCCMTSDMLSTSVTTDIGMLSIKRRCRTNMLNHSLRCSCYQNGSMPHGARNAHA